MTRATAYWLLPRRAERELFHEIIRILARQLKGPRFAPHLTLLVDDKSDSSARRVLAQLKAGPIRLRVRGVSFSADFTRTLYVRFAATRALTGLAARVRAETKRARGDKLDPHISLLYKKLPAKVKREVAATIKLPFRAVTFDAISAVRCRLPTKTSADVRAWRTVAVKKLRK